MHAPIMLLHCAVGLASKEKELKLFLKACTKRVALARGGVLITMRVPYRGLRLSFILILDRCNVTKRHIMKSLQESK